MRQANGFYPTGLGGRTDPLSFVDDARSFVLARIRRGNVTKPIVMDPPAYRAGTQEHKLAAEIDGKKVRLRNPTNQPQPNPKPQPEPPPNAQPQGPISVAIPTTLPKLLKNWFWKLYQAARSRILVTGPLCRD